MNHGISIHFDYSSLYYLGDYNSIYIILTKHKNNMKQNKLNLLSIQLSSAAILSSCATLYSGKLSMDSEANKSCGIHLYANSSRVNQTVAVSSFPFFDKLCSMLRTSDIAGLLKLIDTDEAINSGKNNDNFSMVQLITSPDFKLSRNQNIQLLQKIVERTNNAIQKTQKDGNNLNISQSIPLEAKKLFFHRLEASQVLAVLNNNSYEAPISINSSIAAISESEQYQLVQQGCYSVCNTLTTPNGFVA